MFVSSGEGAEPGPLLPRVLDRGRVTGACEMVTSESAGVAVAHGCDPVRWWVFDGVIDPMPESVIPAPECGIWEAKYDNELEKGKRTTRDRALLEVIAERYLSRAPWSVDLWAVRIGYPLETDPTLHGGGIHVTAPGGWLSTHLDYDLHPHVPGKRRALNLIGFLNPEWREEWGGALVLCDPMGAVVTRLYPKPGRLVAFEVGDLSYHGVEPVTGPVERITAAVYYLAEAGPHNTRRRALFMPSRGKM